MSLFTVIGNTKIAKDVYKMTLSGDTSKIVSAGQFVNVELDGFYLRRPISVCDVDGDTLTLVYKTVGDGTETMSLLPCGEKLDLLCGLGNGYDLSKGGDKPLVIGGGVGVPPMLYLTKKLLASGIKPTVILGFNKKEDVFFESEFNSLGVTTLVATVDGSCGIKGFVTDAVSVADDYDYYYACGPLPMLKALYSSLPCECQMSFEERMGCGFGACMGCSLMTKNGSKRVCKDGPVFEKNEIIF